MQHRSLSSEEEVTNSSTLCAGLKVKLISRIPSLQLTRTTLKASVAVLISLIFVLTKNTRIAMGPACTLAVISTLIYFPVKPVGVQLKVILQGILSACIGSAWCILGNYCANLARNSAIESPMQPASSAVSAVFCAIMIFIVGYIRAKYPSADFTTTFASMIGAFAITQNAAIPGFDPNLTPVLFASAIALMVNLFLWPEDSVSQYTDNLIETLSGYNIFFQANTQLFIEPGNISSPLSFPTLHTKLQDKLIKLVDNQHEIDHVVLFNRLSHRDIKDLTQKVKDMHAPLHGLGVSLLCKRSQLNQVFKRYGASCVEEEVSFLEKHVRNAANPKEDLQSITRELLNTCNDTLVKTSERLALRFKTPERSISSTFLWPFPRFYHFFGSAKHQEFSGEKLSEKLDDVVSRYDVVSRKLLDHLKDPDIVDRFHERFEGLTQITFMFQFNLIGYANSLRAMVDLTEELDRTRVKTRLWFPHLSLKSWCKPSISNQANFGGQINSRISMAESVTESSYSDSGSGKNTLSLNEEEIGSKKYHANADVYAWATDGSNLPCPRNPDADGPETRREKFFFHVGKLFDWCYSMETIFALKTVMAFMLLSLPAYLPQSVGWFTGWGGQWVANAQIMWMLPMTGMFNFTILFGLLGSVIGCILSIIVYEIARGNPYGIAILSFFFVFVPFHYMFFKSPVLSFLGIMVQYAFIMVITTGYQDAVGGLLKNDPIYLEAGKRMIFVVLGIIGAAVANWIPRPVTGRVELRKRLAQTLLGLSRLYAIIYCDILSSSNNAPGTSCMTKNQVKALRQLTLHVQRELKDEETFLRLSKLEPPLKGKFPFETYRTLIEKLNNMADLIEGMIYASKTLDRSWREKLFHVLDEERFDYVACLLNIMRHLSGTLISKTALPPYMIRPADLKNKLSGKFCQVVSQYPEQVYNPSFPSYCAYTIASSRFTEELNGVSKCIENLVGVENPKKWLAMHA